MAKKKRFKTIPTKSSKNQVSKKTLRAQHEQCYLVAKKILRHFELKPELIDIFTKNHRERLLKVFYITPVVKPDKERTVPRPYLRNINTAMYQYLKNNYWGDPENNITYSELATYGLSFLSNIEQAYCEKIFEENSPQFKAAQLICEKFDRDDILTTQFSGLIDEIYHLTSSYSRVSFRIYGFTFNCDKIPKSCGCCNEYRFTIRVTAQNSESKLFTHNNIERKAFKMHRSAIGVYLPEPVTIARNKIFPKAKEDKKLNIYIQSHVLHRFKERLDIYEPTDQNLLIQHALALEVKLVSFENHVLFACMIEEQPVGYFTFFVQDSDIVINTFLPLSSIVTPEGKKLHELLSLNKEELIYIGMDKLSFYLKIDFDQIPTLKQALIDSNIWQTKLVLDGQESGEESKSLIDLNKTNFVKNYFDKLEEHRGGGFH